VNRSEPCLCGAADCRYCHIENFQDNPYYREAIAEQQAKELLELRLDTMEKVLEHLQYAADQELNPDKTHNLNQQADVLQGIYEELQKEGK
jgi:hypothetical protein